MRNTNQPKHLQKGTHRIKENRDTRIKAAARLSRDTHPAKICRILGISPRTLKRYGKDPLWKANDGIELPRYFKKHGVRDPARDAELITEAYRLRDEKKMKWVNIAKRLGLTKRQLEHLRIKYPVDRTPK